MNRLTRTLSLLWVLMFLLAVPAAESSDGQMDRIPLPRNVSSGLELLIDRTSPDTDPGLSIAQLAPLLDFVLADKSDPERFDDGIDTPAAFAYHEFSIRANLRKVLDLSFNPTIPGVVSGPASIRLSYWKSVNGRDQEAPNLGVLLDRLEAPVTIRGVEHLVNSPDQFSGAYYAYDLNRLLILLRHRGQPVLLSVSRQNGTSDVGRKGYVLGPDDDWNYLYSRDTGLSLPGLGWVSSYMYDSYAVIVYAATGAGPGAVKCGVFKWLQAGWAGMNMVRPEHIAKGLARYSESLKDILEHPDLSDVARLQNVFASMRSWSDAVLREKYETCLQTLKTRLGSGASSRQPLTDIGSYVASLDRNEIVSALALEYTKVMVGKTPAPAMNFFLHPGKREARAPKLFDNPG